jgi:hypothetical protein
VADAPDDNSPAGGRVLEFQKRLTAALRPVNDFLSACAASGRIPADVGRGTPAAAGDRQRRVL